MIIKTLNKKIAILMILVLLCVYLITVNTFADTGIVDSVVSSVAGTGDPKVLEAQQWLNETYGGKYYYYNIPEDGKAGYLVVDALIQALQIELGMGYDANGTFGPTTKSLCPTLSKDSPGSNSNIIRILQHGLFCKGYGAYDDYGIFGDQTDKAVKKLQSDVGLDSTGVVNTMIFKAILNTDPYVLSPYGGDANIRFIQQSLNKYYNKYFDLIPCNGIYERATNKAMVCALGAEEGLAASVITGTFGPSTTANCPSLNMKDTRTNLCIVTVCIVL